jgi:hypothetical protein
MPHFAASANNLTMPGFSSRVTMVSRCAVWDGTPLALEKRDKQTVIYLPVDSRDPYDTVITLV